MRIKGMDTLYFLFSIFIASGYSISLPPYIVHAGIMGSIRAVYPEISAVMEI